MLMSRLGATLGEENPSRGRWKFESGSTVQVTSHDGRECASLRGYGAS